MPAVEMVALRDFPFAGRKVKKDETILATPSEERTLRALRWAKPAPQYQTRDQVAAPPQTQQDDEVATRSKPRGRRQYRRRDMQAPEA